MSVTDIQAYLSEGTFAGNAYLIACANSDSLLKAKAEYVLTGTASSPGDEDTLDDILDYISDYGGTLQIFPGLLYFSANWNNATNGANNDNWNGLRLIGSGRSSAHLGTEIKYAGSATDYVITHKRPSPAMTYFSELGNFTIDCENLAGGIEIYRANYGHFHHLYIDDVKTANKGLYIISSICGQIEHVHISGQGKTSATGYGMHADSNNYAMSYDHLYLNGFGVGFYGYLSQGCSMYHGRAEQNVVGFEFTKVEGGGMYQTYAENNDKADILITCSSASGCLKIDGGQLSGSHTEKCAGTATSADATGITLTDTGATFETDEVAEGDRVTNVRDHSYSTVLTVDSETQITLAAALANGSDNEWASSDEYEIGTGNTGCRYGIHIPATANIKTVKICNLKSKEHTIAAVYVESGNSNLEQVIIESCDFSGETATYATEIIDSDGKVILHDQLSMILAENVSAAYEINTVNDETIWRIGTVINSSGVANLLTNPAATIAAAAGVYRRLLQLTPGTTTLTGSTGVNDMKGCGQFINTPTIADSSVVTVARASNLYIAGAPAAGGSATITKSYAADINGKACLNGNELDEYKKTTENHTSADTLTSAESGSIHTNYGASGNLALTLPSDATAGVFYNFIVGAAHQLQIKVGAASHVIIADGTVNTDDGGADGYIWADDEGESLELTCIATGVWLGKTTGTWTWVQP